MIEIKDLKKLYKETLAVDGVSLKISEGETFGFLGPNGAGKTTLILMLSTLLKPTSGKASINGHDIALQSNLVKRDMGILFQDVSLDEKLTGWENLEIQAALYDIPRPERAQRIDSIIKFLGLGDWAHIATSRYSGGMKRRLELGRCLLHRPKVLLLDEPTLGLDPTARKVIWSHIEKLSEITIIIATNYIEEAERLCQRIGVIESGKLAAVGTPDELKSSIKKDYVKIKTKNPEKLKKELTKFPYLEDFEIREKDISFTVDRSKRKELLANIGGIDSESVEIRKPDLSDVFLSYTGKSIDIPIEKVGRGRRRRRRM